MHLKMWDGQGVDSFFYLEKWHEAIMGTMFAYIQKFLLMFEGHWARVLPILRVDVKNDALKSATKKQLTKYQDWIFVDISNFVDVVLRL